MTDFAGFGIPDWLPLATQKALRAEEAREYREARDAEIEQDQRTEAKRSAAIALYAEQAELRGEHVSAFALATGQVPGRTAGEVLATAAAMADIEDRREEARARREEDGPLNFCFDSPPATRAETAEGREVRNTVRHYAEQHPDSDVIDRAFIASETRSGSGRTGRCCERAGAASARRGAGLTGPGTVRGGPCGPAGPARSRRGAAADRRPAQRRNHVPPPGVPTVETQMKTHGAPAPRTPDVGGHG